MRILQRALPAISVALLCGHLASAQNSQSNETFSAGAGGAYDPSVCNDNVRIAENDAALKSTAYHDPTPAGNGVTSPLRAALNELAQKTGNPQVNNASVCLGAPGVIYFVPTNLVGQVTQLLEQEKAGQPGGDTYNGSGNNTPPGQTGGKSGGGGSGGGGGPGINDTPPRPGPAGGAGYKASSNPCIDVKDYNYCNNGPGAWLPENCICDNSAGITLHGGTTVTRWRGVGRTSITVKKNGKKLVLPIPLNIDVGEGFPLQGIGYVDQDPDDPDPNVMKTFGTLNKTRTVFTVTSVNFTPLAQTTYGVGTSYTFPVGKQPTVSLAQYQANIK
jgi:hypothetical protein